MSDVSITPILQVTEPTNGSSMAESNLTLGINASASPSTVLWAEVGFNVSTLLFGNISFMISFPVFNNGAWSTDGLWLWDAIVNVIGLLMPESVTLSVIVHDFDSYSEQVSVTIYFQ